MFDKLKKELYFSKVQLLFNKGVQEGKIIPFDDEFYEKMSHTLPSNRVEMIKNEISETEAMEDSECIDTLKYLASLSVLIDLSLQGWIFDIKNNSLTLKMENDMLY